MLSVFEYPISLPVEDFFSLTLPADAKILTVQAEDDRPQIFALIDLGKQCKVRRRYFYVARTGWDIREKNDDLIYIGTFQLSDRAIGGAMTAHLFEVIRKK